MDDIFPKDDIKHCLWEKLRLERKYQESKNINVELEFRVGTLRFESDEKWKFEPQLRSASEKKYSGEMYKFLQLWCKECPQIIQNTNKEVQYYKSYQTIADIQNDEVLLNVQGIHQPENKEPLYISKKRVDQKTYVVTNRPLDVRMSLNVESRLEGEQLRSVQSGCQDFFRYCRRLTYQITLPYSGEVNGHLYEWRCVYNVDITQLSSKLVNKEDEKEPFSFMLELELVSSFLDENMNVLNQVDEKMIRTFQIEKLTDRIVGLLWMICGATTSQISTDGVRKKQQLNPPVFRKIDRQGCDF